MVEKYLDQANQEKWRGGAWYYVPSFVRRDVTAQTADEAMAVIRRMMDTAPDFWCHQELDRDGASPVNIEVWDEAGKLVAAEFKASLRVCDEDVGYPRLEVDRIVEEIDSFEVSCQHENHTDTGELWSKLHDWRARLTKLFGPRDLPF